MRNKVVVITGASKGIGLASAKAFAALGANVVMLARGAEQLNQEAATIGANATPIVADVSDPNSVRAAFAEIEKKFGRVDVLVNNAGMSFLATIEEFSDKEIMDSFSTNLLGPIYTTRSAIPLLKQAGGGDVINISSEATMLPFPFMTLYASSKAGLETFTEASVTELKPLGVRATTVVCGATETGFGSYWDPDQMLRFMTAAQASGHLAFAGADKMMNPNDVAAALVFIATRPVGQTIGVMHVRSYAVGDGQATVEKKKAEVGEA